MAGVGRGCCWDRAGGGGGCRGCVTSVTSRLTDVAGVWCGRWDRATPRGGHRAVQGGVIASAGHSVGPGGDNVLMMCFDVLVPPPPGLELSCTMLAFKRKAMDIAFVVFQLF